MDELLDRAPCGFVSFRNDGTVLDINQTLVDILGTARDHVIGRSFESLLTIASRIFYQTHFFPLLRLQSCVEEIYLTLRTADGPGDVAMLANVSARGEGDGIIYDCILMRLRERRKWEDEILRAKRAAEEANRAKSGLISMMSHDLRTPLGAISGYCDLLTMGVRGEVNEAQIADLERIKKSSDYLLSLIDDVLNFARLNAGQIDNLAIQSLSADFVLSRTEILMGTRFEQAGLEYHRHNCDASVKLLADPDRLQQILLNLLGNAVKFTPRGGSISVSCELADDRALIHVTDTGVGIAQNQLDRIFEPFVQAAGTSTTAREQKGFGLGLAISRELARRMNGDLTATSTVGVGSTFTLTLQA
ncbi:MAG TPA: PAS domain-containing sensor histidine kinase [Gemmatimonadaceae bacterium]|nr:PAS domain-containing sensor histidine kinase [Gemmatimonadaceae bacterium]